ncbi:MAG: hypothetical protein ACYC67_27005 [Prosthecobacter sp.]
MPKRSSTRKPKEDFSQTAFRIVQELTSEKPAEATLSTALDNDGVRKEIMREMGRRGGKIGGEVRKASLSVERRKEIAQQAANTRWGKDKG